jgi:hypothetical protein
MKKVSKHFTSMQSTSLIFSLKLMHIATERSAEKHADYVMRIGPYSHNQLVFVDESACDRHTTYQDHAWAILGQHAIRKAFFVCGKR